MIREGERVNDLTFSADDEPIGDQNVYKKMKECDIPGLNKDSTDALFDIQVKIDQNSLAKSLQPADFRRPAMVQLKTFEPGWLTEHLPRVPIDLICVIDKSGSMLFGGKIQNLKRTLNTVIELLNPNDRLSIIEYDSKAKRLTNLRCCTPQNKTYFQEVIDKIEPSGGTSIADGLLVASRVLELRREKNRVSSIFLLSDGDDPKEKDLIEKISKEYQKKFKGSVSLNTFGYGEDHNEDLMASIADSCGGMYYSVEVGEDLGDMFGDCLGRIVSVIAEKTKVSVNLLPTEESPEIKFAKTYGDQWTGISEISKTIDVGYLVAGTEQTFVFELDIPLDQKAAPNNEVVILKVDITADMFFGDNSGPAQLTKEIYLTLKTTEKPDILTTIDDQVKMEHLKVVSAEKQNEIIYLIDNKMNKEAEEAHLRLLSSIQNAPQAMRQCQDYQDIMSNTQRMGAYTRTGWKTKGRKACYFAAKNQSQGISCYKSKKMNSLQGVFRNRIRNAYGCEEE